MEHPYALAIALLSILPVIAPLARYFFESWSQFLEDNYLLTDDDRKVNAIFAVVFQATLSKPGVFINTVLFFAVLAAWIATAYHLIVLGSQLFI